MQFTISGKVIRGDGYGRKLGFRTANLDQKLENFSSGVYGGKAVLNRRTYRAGIIIHDDGHVDAHLIGFRGDAYGKMLTLIPKIRLRSYIKFETEAELIEQIKKDLKQC